MFPNVLQQEVINYLDICQDDEILKHSFFIKSSKNIWLKNSKHEFVYDKYHQRKEWSVNGFCHREQEDGPAIEYKNGNMHWYKNGLLHRNNDQPATLGGVNGYRAWATNGKYHRLTGPAREWLSTGYKEWFIDDINISETEFNLHITSLSKSNQH